jgi:SAM-dependent methyltransferase
MHESAMANAKRFFDTYAKYKDLGTVIDIGSQDVNGSIKQVCPERFDYIGVDYQAASNVDVVLQNPYKFPFENESIDIVVSSSCLEHSEFFWLTWLEMARVVKPNGLIYINVPTDGVYHPYPVDCWRFRGDSAKALERWSKHNNYRTTLLEGYVDSTMPWKDFVGIYVGSYEFVSNYPDTIPKA